MQLVGKQAAMPARIFMIIEFILLYMTDEFILLYMTDEFVLLYMTIELVLLYGECLEIFKKVCLSRQAKSMEGRL